MLLAGVVPNPGSVTGLRGDSAFGSINIHSAFDRAALVISIIADHDIDLMALKENRIEATDPNAVQADVAPVGYWVLGWVYCTFIVCLLPAAAVVAGA